MRSLSSGGSEPRLAILLGGNGAVIRAGTGVGGEDDAGDGTDHERGVGVLGVVKGENVKLFLLGVEGGSCRSVCFFVS